MASAQMALGIYLDNKRKRKASATAGMSFVLDREGHMKFLRVSTNHELEDRNKQLEAENEKLKQEIQGQSRIFNEQYAEYYEEYQRLRSTYEPWPNRSPDGHSDVDYSPSPSFVN